MPYTLNGRTRVRVGGPNGDTQAGAAAAITEAGQLVDELTVEMIPRDVAPTEHVAIIVEAEPELLRVLDDEPEPVVLPFEAALSIARGELGVHEIPGPESNVRIELYHSTTRGSSDSELIAWCASFMNWVIIQTGREGTNSRGARSYLRWGEAIEKPRMGCVVVLWRDDPNSVFGHVGFYVGEDANSVFILGGNTGNAVAIHKYPKARVLGYRWIKEA